MADKRDFFISFTGADTDIATAINGALRNAGYSTWFYPEDLGLGSSIADWMEVALDNANQMIAICSPTYFDRSKGYSRAERQSMFWADPTNNEPLLILVKVEEVAFPRLIAANQYVDLIGLPAADATAKLLDALSTEAARKARAAAAEVKRSRRRPEVFNVPGGLNPLFTGRETELERLAENLARGGATAITAVKGMGGVGKTSLAREYAHRHGTAARYGGVWWIAAETETGILAGLEALAERVEAIPKGDTQRETAESARDWLGRQPDAFPWLVIFDNAPDAKTVAPWRPGGSARVIVTSRYAAFDKIATPMSLDVWDEDTTTGYLMERRPGGSEAEARALARRLDGLPLAAEQAGAFLAERPTLSFAEYEARLVDMLGREPEELPDDYPMSVFQTFAVAIEAVEDREEGAAAVGLLSLCCWLSPDGVELGMLEACAAQTQILPEPLRGALADPLRRAEALRALNAFSLARLGEDPDWGQTVILHRLVAEIARARLESDAATAWSGAAVETVGRLMQGTQGGKGDPTVDTSVWPLYARMLPHARTLQDMPVGPGRTSEALFSVLNQAALYLSARGDSGSALVLQRENVELAEAVYGNPSENLAVALGNLANQLRLHEETWDEAEAAYARSLEILEQVLPPGDPSLAIMLSNMGWIPWQRKEFETAANLNIRAAEIDKAAHGAHSPAYATRLNNLGAVYGGWARATGDPEPFKKRQESYEEAARVSRAGRGPRHPVMAAAYNNLAALFSDTEDTARAAEEMARAVAVDLSLDQLAHPDTQRHIAALLQLWSETGEAAQVEALMADSGKDFLPTFMALLRPIVEEIEAEHRAWVAEDPETRKFGPPSPVTGATE